MNEEKTEAATAEEEQEQKFRLRTIISDTDVMALRKQSDPVNLVVADNSSRAYPDKETVELIDALKEYVRKNDGLGMAAVQLGVHQRLFVMRRPFNSGQLLVVINPVLVRGSGLSTKGEGCFSIPETPGEAMVSRFSTIFVNYTDEEGLDHQEEMLVGMDARIFQHELDHLEGILMIDQKDKRRGFRGWRRSF
jgi:peptide deformylase